MQLTQTMAQFIATTGPAEISAEAFERARRAVLDTVGVMLVGSREDCARIAGELVRAEEPRPVAAVVGQKFRSSVRGAALINGVAGHALDYDDVNPAMGGHPSVSVLPAVLAVAEETGAAGRDVLTALILGFEVEVKLGRGLGRSHYARGWHATSTLGTLGAAAAAAKLYGLDADQIRMALGIATSLASGSRQNFGTMTKPLHPGAAAHNGVMAVQLAARGFSADAEILEAPLGYLNLFSPAEDAEPDRVIAGLGAPFEIVGSGISVKQYPCGFNVHWALDATLTLCAEETVHVDDIEHVDVLVPRGTAAPLIHPRPTTGLEGKFSMPYCVAAAILDRKVGLDTFEDVSVQRPLAQSLLRRVEMREDAVGNPTAGGFAVTTIVLRDGRRIRRRVSELRGSASSPLTLEELSAKYRDCAERVLGAAATDHSLELILNLEDLPSVAPLSELLLGRSTVA